MPTVVEPVNPCQPSPCGPNAQCQVINESPSCSCLQEFIGSPPNCRPECVSNSECSSHLACINQKCRDPCPGSCGVNAECRVVSHTPMCVCTTGYFGDPFTQCIQQCKDLTNFASNIVIGVWNHLKLTSSHKILADPVISEKLSPCTPSPCGSNAICKEQNGVGSCTCVPEYIGNPYEGCRPECTINSDCISSLACIRSKCQNPCPGTCSQNAECQVISHLPSCTCVPGFTGDPFRYCHPQQPISKWHTEYNQNGIGFENDNAVLNQSAMIFTWRKALMKPLINQTKDYLWQQSITVAMNTSILLKTN